MQKDFSRYKVKHSPRLSAGSPLHPTWSIRCDYPVQAPDHCAGTDTASGGPGYLAGHGREP